MAAPGAFDTSYFPEISDDRSSYESPLTAINQKLRRKNVVAAAAVSGPNMSLHDSSDPWSSAADSFGGLQKNDLFTSYEQSASVLQGFCACSGTGADSASENKTQTPILNRSRFGRIDAPLTSSTKTRATAATTTKRRSSSIHQPGAPARCAKCGKRIMNPSDMAWGRPRPRRMSLSTAKTSACCAPSVMVDPEHAKALLQSTPKLRHISSSPNDTPRWSEACA